MEIECVYVTPTRMMNTFVLTLANKFMFGICLRIYFTVQQEGFNFADRQALPFVIVDLILRTSPIMPIMHCTVVFISLL